jgi:hypothetical protein
MPQENWIAIRQADENIEQLLGRYGFHIRSEDVIANPKSLTAVRAERRAPRGYSAFYVFRVAPWTLILDSEGLLWEQLSLHSLASRLYGDRVVVVVARAPAGAFGFGIFEGGRVVRWIFRKGDVVGQTYGAQQPWETGDESPANIGPLLRETQGIRIEEAPNVRVVYAFSPELRPEPRGSRLRRLLRIRGRREAPGTFLNHRGG